MTEAASARDRIKAAGFEIVHEDESVRASRTFAGGRVLDLSAVSLEELADQVEAADARFSS